MSARVNVDGEAQDTHAGSCLIWESPDPGDGCTCGGIAVALPELGDGAGAA